MAPTEDHPLLAGVQVVPLRRIPDERGTILHMLRRSDPHFIEFGEIYFTTIYRGVVKGWHRHRDMTLNYACIDGHTITQPTLNHFVVSFEFLYLSGDPSSGRR